MQITPQSLQVASSPSPSPSPVPASQPLLHFRRFAASPQRAKPAKLHTTAARWERLRDERLRDARLVSASPAPRSSCPGPTRNIAPHPPVRDFPDAAPSIARYIQGRARHGGLAPLLCSRRLHRRHRPRSYVTLLTHMSIATRLCAHPPTPPRFPHLPQRRNVGNSQPCCRPAQAAAQSPPQPRTSGFPSPRLGPRQRDTDIPSRVTTALARGKTCVGKGRKAAPIGRLAVARSQAREQMAPVSVRGVHDGGRLS